MSEPISDERLEAPATVEDRLARLERVFDAIRTHRTEGSRLAESVDRLGLNANALQETLLQVDRNQQQLTKLGQELDETRAIVVPREEHERMDAERRKRELAYRKRVLNAVYAGSIALLFLLLAVGVVAANYVHGAQKAAYSNCQASNLQRAHVRAYLDAVKQNSTNVVLRDAASKAVDEMGDVNCQGTR